MKSQYSFFSRLCSKLWIPVLVILNVSCSPGNSSNPVMTAIENTLNTSTPSPFPTETTNFLQPTPSPTSTISPLPTCTPTDVQPVGCKLPPENYELVEIHGMVINQRTYSMLLNTQVIYGGELDLTGYHLTQGSYNSSVSASFGTHDGGGAVDLSVIQYGTYEVLFDDIDPLINALRTAGFAAWLRDFDQLYPGSPIHIHAIAIGDRDLSQAAIDQLTGEFGYFKGFNGIPQPQGGQPVADEYGGPIICQWMIDAGYQDLRDLTP